MYTYFKNHKERSRWREKWGEWDRIARELDTARSLFHNNAYTLKPICCTLTGEGMVVARDTARLRVKVSLGFAARKISRVTRWSEAAARPHCTFESEYPRITGGWRRYTRLYLLVNLWSIDSHFACIRVYCRNAVKAGWTEGEGAGDVRIVVFGDNSYGKCFRNCCELATHGMGWYSEWYLLTRRMAYCFSIIRT